jgi:hypothetical protein
MPPLGTTWHGPVTPNGAMRQQGFERASDQANNRLPCASP